MYVSRFIIIYFNINIETKGMFGFYGLIFSPHILFYFSFKIAKYRN
jgi:hypothetical protein